MSDQEASSGIDIAAEVNRFLEKLLDLTNRNRLLSYRKTKRTTLQIVDELPNQIYEHLILKGKKFRFDATAEKEPQLFSEGTVSEWTYPALCTSLNERIWG